MNINVFLKKAFTFIIGCFLLTNAYSEKSSVTGVSKDYAGQQLVLKTYSDEIMYTVRELGKTDVDSTGNFSLEYDINTTTTCFFELGVYHAIFFAVPGQTISLMLPPFTPLTPYQELNPYFERQKIFLYVKEETGINDLVSEFEDAFDYYYVKSALQPDSMQHYLSELKKISGVANNSFFEAYKGYKYAMILNLNRNKQLSTSQMSELGVSYENFAFWEAFNTIFENFFNAFGAGSVEQKAIENALNTRDFEALCMVLETQFNIQNKSLQELVIIKGLFDSYFFKDDKASYFFNMLKFWEPEIVDKHNKTILSQIISYLTGLSSSTEAFDFKLTDENGKEYQLSSFKGKYVYLNFCSTQVALSKNDFGILARYATTYRKDMFVVNIFVDPSRANMDSFVKRLKKHNMVNLFWNDDHELLDRYRVINIPTYFLIDREGNMKLAPAPTPDQDFEQKLEEILFNEKQKDAEPQFEDKWWE